MSWQSVTCVSAFLCMAWPAPSIHAASRRDPSVDRMGAIMVDGRRRTYLVHVPSTMPRATPWPLVIVLHGHGSSIRHTIRITGLSAKADREAFLVVYPNGTGWLNLRPRGWNAGSCCGYPVRQQVDDVRFIKQLIAHLEDTLAIDASRIYVTGISNGGMMAYRVGCELTDEIAAIAPVAGAMTVPHCTPRGPLPVIIFHGTQDQHVPYAGGRSPLTHDTRLDPPVAATVAFWVRHNQAGPTPQRDVRGHIVRDAYAAPSTGADVVLYTVQDGGHAWPGGARGWSFGAEPTTEISATDLMWEFFVRHPKR